MKIRRIEYEVGNDAYSRAVTLILEPSSTGQMQYGIYVEAANQRDETQRVIGLTREVILAMAEAVKAGGAA